VELLDLGAEGGHRLLALARRRDDRAVQGLRLGAALRAIGALRAPLPVRFVS
jgi:hypothetical protein